MSDYRLVSIKDVAFSDTAVSLTFNEFKGSLLISKEWLMKLKINVHDLSKDRRVFLKGKSGNAEHDFWKLDPLADIILVPDKGSNNVMVVASLNFSSLIGLLGVLNESELNKVCSVDMYKASRDNIWQVNIQTARSSSFLLKSSLFDDGMLRNWKEAFTLIE